MDCQLGNHDFGYHRSYITDRNPYNGVLKDEPGRRNSVTSCFQQNFDSVYSIMIIASVLGGIVKNVHCQFAFDIVILAHTLE